MDKTKIFSATTIILLALSCTLVLQFKPADAATWVLTEKGETYEVYRNGLAYKYTSTPAQIWNGSAWTPMIFTDKYPSEGYYQVQTALVGIRIFDYYAVIYDPNVTSVKVYDERFEVQRYTNKWNNIGAQSGSPTFNIAQTDKNLNISKSFTCWAGVLTVKYVFSEGASLKHEVSFKSTLATTETYRVIHNWNGIVASSVKTENQTLTSVTLEKSVASTCFSYETNGKRSVFIDQKDAGKYLQPTLIDVHAQGLKATYTYGSWTLTQNQILLVDPDTYTAPDAVKDSKVWSYYPNTNYGADQVANIQGSASESQRSYLEFNISVIDPGYIINSATLKLYFAGAVGGRTYDVNRVTGAWTEMGITWNTQPTVDSNFVSMASLSSQGWWNVSVTSISTLGDTLGFRVKDQTETGASGTATFYTSEYVTVPTRRPILEIVYTPPDTTVPTFGEITANTTFSGETMSLNCIVNDDAAVSSYIYSWNNTGSWVNQTAIAFSVFNNETSANATFTGIWNSTFGNVISVKIYANDTSNNWGSSEVYNFTLTQVVIPSPNESYNLTIEAENYVLKDSNGTQYYSGANASLAINSVLQLTNVSLHLSAGTYSDNGNPIDQIVFGANSKLYGTDAANTRIVLRCLTFSGQFVSGTQLYGLTVTSGGG